MPRRLPWWSILNRWLTRRSIARRAASTSTLTCHCDRRRLPIGHSGARDISGKHRQIPPCRHNSTRIPLHREDNKASSPLSEEAVMRGFEWRTVLAAAIAASGIFMAAGAQAHDDDDWRWKHRHHDHGRWHHEPERRVVYGRPVVYERP